MCYRLSLLDWKIVPVTRGMQKLHMIQRGDKQFVVKVRSLTKVAPVPFPQGLDVLDDMDYLVICNNLQEKPNLIVMKPQTIRDVIHKDTINETAYWLQDRDYTEHGMGIKQVFG